MADDLRPALPPPSGAVPERPLRCAIPLEYVDSYPWIPGGYYDTTSCNVSRVAKSLAFLGSIYTNDVAWKKMRARHGASETKREE